MVANSFALSLIEFPQDLTARSLRRRCTHLSQKKKPKTDFGFLIFENCAKRTLGLSGHLVKSWSENFEKTTPEKKKKRGIMAPTRISPTCQALPPCRASRTFFQRSCVETDSAKTLTPLAPQTGTPVLLRTLRCWAISTKSTSVLHQRQSHGV